MRAGIVGNRPPVVAGADDADVPLGFRRGGLGLLITRGGPTVSRNPVAVYAVMVTTCVPSGVSQRSPTLNIEPSLLEVSAAGTSASTL